VEQECEQFYLLDGKQMKVNASPRTKEEFMRQKTLIEQLRLKIAELQVQLAAKEAIIEGKTESPQQTATMQKLQTLSSIREESK
jgi:hypothetical protein